MLGLALTVSVGTTGATGAGDSGVPDPDALRPTRVISGEGFFTATLTMTLYGEPFTASQTFFVPAVVPGVTTLRPELKTSEVVFFGPFTVFTQQIVQPPLFSDTDTFFTATLTSALVSLTPSLVTDVDTFYTAAINLAPDITSAATVTVFIGETNSFYTATATDPDNDTVTWALEGADAEFFSIDPSSGQVTIVPE